MPRVGFVDDDHARGGDHGYALAHLEVQVAVAVMDLLDEVDNQGRDAAVSVAHLRQGEPMSAVGDPQAIGIDFGDLVVVGQQPVGQDLDRGPAEFAGPFLAFQ